MGVLSLALWLFMVAAEAWTPLHAWLHGGAVPDGDDDCAIVALSQGKVESATCDVPVIVPATFVEAAPCIAFSVVTPTIENLPLGRAPPVLCVVS